jgi:cbb3-type cytochrome oxidase subunit 1
MDVFVKAFLKASLAWLALGVTLGVGMAVHPAWLVYRPAHVHMNLLGFVTMMIYGVAYHVIPRFSGHALHSRRLAIGQWWVSNVGLALMVAGFVTRVHGFALATAMLGAGGSLAALGAYGFVFNVWRTMDGHPAHRLVMARAAHMDSGRNADARTAPRGGIRGVAR